MDAITFKVPAVPVAQPRARATAINGKARMYEAKTSHPIHDYKASVRMSAAQVYQGPPLTGPLAVVLTFVFATKSKARRWKATRPDNDNLAKGTLDALNGLLFVDDGQVCELTVQKFHASKDEQPHVLVTIRDAVECKHSPTP